MSPVISWRRKVFGKYGHDTTGHIEVKDGLLFPSFFCTFLQEVVQITHSHLEKFCIGMERTKREGGV